MDTEEIKKIVLEETVEVEGKKKLSCPKAFEISKNHSISLKEIGDCCNENEIKIFGCQLGCFE
jgi:hypothetical protein